jgi:hypothetical protein
MRLSRVYCNSRAFDKEPAVGDLEALAVAAVRTGGQLDDLNGPAVRCTVPITHTGIMPQVRPCFALYSEGALRLADHIVGAAWPVRVVPRARPLSPPGLRSTQDGQHRGQAGPARADLLSGAEHGNTAWIHTVRSGEVLAQITRREVCAEHPVLR